VKWRRQRPTEDEEVNQLRPPVRSTPGAPVLGSAGELHAEISRLFERIRCIEENVAETRGWLFQGTLSNDVVAVHPELDADALHLPPFLSPEEVERLGVDRECHDIEGEV